MAKKELSQIVGGDLYNHKTLPVPLREEAKRQGKEIKEGLIAVKYMMNSPLSVQFYMIGNKPESLTNFYHQIAAEDGVNLDKVLRNLVN